MDTPKSNHPSRGALQTRHVYTLHGEIAWGGMATVRLARQSGPHGWSRIVAVKNLLSRTAPDSEFVAMFRDEIRVASRVNHPNVVPVLDVVAADDQLLLVMEYVHGETVARLLKRSRTVMPPEIASTIMIGVLRGLHAAHLARTERGEPLHIVHRDVTPHNMIVGVDGTPRLLDFGIAHAAGRRHETRVGQIKGKLAYMAPEQFSEGAVDCRVDIYSAAVTLWEMLTGGRLFEGHKDNILRMILHQAIQPPGALQAGISPQLDAIVMRGLHRDPRLRYETAREMAIALERETKTVSTTELGDWVRRTWGAAGHRREEQIKAIEGRLSPPADEDTPTKSEDTKVEAPRRRRPISERTTRPVDLAERLSSLPVRRLSAPRVDTPTAAFGEQRRVSGFGAAAPVPATRPHSVLITWAPILVVVVVGTFLIGHLWRDTGTRPQPAPRLVASAVAPAPHLPKVEPLPVEVESTSVPGKPTTDNPPSGTALDANRTAPPAVQSPEAAARSPEIVAPTRVSPPRQEGNTVKRRTSRYRPPRRVPARAAVDSTVPPRPAITPGALVDPMGPPIAPAASSARPECDPPFVIDRAGIKRFKLSCL